MKSHDLSLNILCLSHFSSQSPLIEGEFMFSVGEHLEENEVYKINIPPFLPKRDLQIFIHVTISWGGAIHRPFQGWGITGSELLLISGTRNVIMNSGSIRWFWRPNGPSPSHSGSMVPGATLWLLPHFLSAKLGWVYLAAGRILTLVPWSKNKKHCGSKYHAETP